MDGFALDLDFGRGVWGYYVLGGEGERCGLQIRSDARNLVHSRELTGDCLLDWGSLGVCRIAVNG